MNVLNLSELPFTKELPQEEGKFLYKNTLGEIEIITVYHYPAKDDYGIYWEAYYGVVDHRGRNVLNYEGEFLKIV